MPGDDLRGALLAALDNHLDAAIALRHEVHADPELGNEEHRTAQRIAAALGHEVAPRRVLRTGLLARVGPTHDEPTADVPDPNGSPLGEDDDTGRAARPVGRWPAAGKTAAVALRAELDALPLREQTGVAFAATNGRMHACGHDVHMAALVAVCRAAADVGVARPLLGVFQPSEERYPSGAQQLVVDGMLARERVGAMLAVHLHPQPASDEVAIGEGAINASSDEFELIVDGEGGHGAYPHRTRDPVLALSHVVVSLQQIVARRVDPLHSVVIGIGTLHADGAANIVPSRASARGTLRCLQAEDRAAMQGLVTEVAELTARTHGCRATVRFEQGEPALHNDPRLLAEVANALPGVGLRAGPAMRSCGSDDFGFFTEHVPSAMLFLGVDDDPRSPGLHHPRFLPADAAVASTARAQVAMYLAGCTYLDARGDALVAAARSPAQRHTR